jgi:hypothetical protein
MEFSLRFYLSLLLRIDFSRRHLSANHAVPLEKRNRNCEEYAQYAAAAHALLEWCIDHLIGLSANHPMVSREIFRFRFS